MSVHLLFFSHYLVPARNVPINVLLRRIHAVVRISLYGELWKINILILILILRIDQ